MGDSDVEQRQTETERAAAFLRRIGNKAMLEAGVAAQDAPQLIESGVWQAFAVFAAAEALERGLHLKESERADHD